MENAENSPKSRQTKINMIMAQFKVVKIPSDTQHEDERFNAFFYSKDYETIFGKKMNEIKEINRFIKITNGGKEKKAIYLQYRALPGINKGEIALNYENTCSLSVKEGNSVVVEPISKITYSWQNLDIIGKVSFSVSIIAFILSLLNMFNII